MSSVKPKMGVPRGRRALMACAERSSQIHRSFSAGYGDASRPSRRARWQYAFVVDFIGHQEDEKVRGALEHLEESCEQIRILGSYPRDVNS